MTPAPLGNTPTRKMPKITVFGLEDSQATRGAVRFFRERRVIVTFVDVGNSGFPPAELRFFAERLGAEGLAIEGEAAPAGTPTIRTASGDRIPTDPRLLRMPLVRHGNEATAGRAEETWKAWLAARASAAARTK
jgi:arsenate reductase (glutaredoxin)